MSSERVNTGFSVRLGISVGVISVLVLLIVATYVCKYKRLFQHPADGGGGGGGMNITIIMEMEGSLMVEEFPKVQFSQAAANKLVQTTGSSSSGSSNSSSTCSICLLDYKEDDWVVQLVPHCTHMFHVDCIRAWLCLHDTCPVCRTRTRTHLSSTRPTTAT